MIRVGMMVLGLLALAVVGGCAWMLGGSSAFASASDSPSVIIDEPVDKASYTLLDVTVPEDLKRMDDEVERATGRGVIRTKKDGNAVTWIFELDDTDFVTVVAQLEAVSETKSELDVNVRLEDSPLTEDGGLLPSDRLIIQNTLDAALTEHIAAKLEGRPADKRLLSDINTRLELANMLQRDAFAERVEAAIDRAIKPHFETYAEQARRRSDHASSPYQTDYQARRAQREASAPTSSAEPMTRLPAN